MYYVSYMGKNFLSNICILAFFEVLTRAFTIQGCGKLTDFVHFSAFAQCLLCSSQYKLSGLKCELTVHLAVPISTLSKPSRKACEVNKKPARGFLSKAMGYRTYIMI